jgi:hypothetical protein
MHHILTNKFYTGHFVFKGLSYVGHHPPLVSIDLFNQVQRQLKASNKPDYEKRELSFANLITCGHCGCNVVGDIKQKGRYIYYRCTHFKQKCPDKYIREEKLQEQFKDMVSDIQVSEEQFQWMVDSLKAINVQKDQILNENRENLQKEIKRLSSRLSQLYEDKLDGIITHEFYLKKADEGKERIEVLNEKLKRFEDASNNQMELGLLILEFAKNASLLFEQLPSYEQGKFLKILLSKCDLKAGKLCPTYKKPFDVLAERAQKERWYTQKAPSEKARENQRKLNKLRGAELKKRKTDSAQD